MMFFIKIQITRIDHLKKYIQMFFYDNNPNEHSLDRNSYTTCSSYSSIPNDGFCLVQHRNVFGNYPLHMLLVRLESQSVHWNCYRTRRLVVFLFCHRYNRHRTMNYRNNAIITKTQQLSSQQPYSPPIVSSSRSNDILPNEVVWSTISSGYTPIDLETETTILWTYNTSKRYKYNKEYSYPQNNHPQTTTRPMLLMQWNL
jgi:hypothetical protein